MTYEVVVTEEAEGEIAAAYDWLESRTPQNAPAWYNGLIDLLLSLEDFPERSLVAPESRDSPEVVRQMIYGDKRHGYRVLYVIRGQRVVVLNVRHASRGR